MLISPLGGPEREVTRVVSFTLGENSALAWAPDGKLAFADQESSTELRYSIFLLSTATGVKRRLTNPPPQDLGDMRFSFSPDGEQLAFARYRTSTTADIYLLALRMGGEPKRLVATGDTVENVAWAPSGNEIVYSSGGALWRVGVNAGAAQPTRVTGMDSPARYPVLSRSGRLVYVRRNIDNNIWRLDLSRPGAQPALIIASTHSDDFPNLSSDSSRLVFSSHQSGYYEIWASDGFGANPVQLTMQRAASHSPKWSPDGSRIAFSSMVNGNRDIYTMDASGGSLTRLTHDPTEEGRPSWSRDGKFIYFYSKRTGRLEIWKMPASGGTAVQITTGGGHSGEESADGKEFLYGKWDGKATAVIRHPLFGGAEELILDKTMLGWWAICDRGIYFAEMNGPISERMNPPIPVKFLDSTTKKVTKVMVIEKPIHAAATGLSVSRDGKSLVWVQTDHLDSDLMLVENFK